MKLKTLGLVLPSLTLLAASLQAAEVAPVAPPATAATADVPAVAPAPPSQAPATAEAPAAPEEGGTVITSVITPRLFAFHTFKGWWGDRTHFLERYDYREGFAGDNRSDVFADLDLDVNTNNGERDAFVLERRGFGQHNHRGTAKYGNDALNVYGSYSHYRSATGGIDYLLSPGQVDGGRVSSGPYQTFNDDANRYDFTVDRTTYGAGFKVKPSVLEDMATVSVDYEGYQRDGNKFATFFLDTPGLAGNERWRGIDLDVDERMNRVGLTLSASPKKLFEVAYEVSYEQFVSDVGELQMERDILGPSGVNLSGVGANARLSSFFYVPDTKLTSHAIRASKNFNDHVVVAAGYGMSSLKQDSFTARETNAGHTKGQISTDNAYLTANAVVSADVSVEGHIKYYNRDNDSTFPDGLIGPSGPARLVSPRINDIESLDYGLSANWRPDFMKSNVTAGWRRLDRDRSLTWGVDPNHDIQPAQSLYREQTLSDEVYLKWSARPAKGWTTRLTPSFTWADKTGLVAEPEEAFMLKAMASYAAPAGWLVSGFYDYKSKQNDNNTFTDGSAGPGTPLTYNQDIESTLHSLGFSLNVMPRDNVNAYANLYWMQDDFSSYLFRTNNERWHPSVNFTQLDERPNYKIDSYVFSLGGDWQCNDKLKLNGSYTYSKSKGNVASGIVFTELQNATGTIDSIIDNTLHSLSLGADYTLSEKATLRVNYIFDYYDDNAYDLLTGGVNMLAVGVSFTM
jgi:hypothetical protein